MKKYYNLISFLKNNMTYRATISFDSDLAEKIRGLKNRSRIVNLALKQFYRNNLKRAENPSLSYEEEQEIKEALNLYQKEPETFSSFEEVFGKA